MLHADQLIQALHEKVEEFRNFETQESLTYQNLSEALEAFVATPMIMIDVRLSGEDFPGAKPTEELAKYQSLCVPFKQEFENHQSSRKWAASILKGSPTLAIDGSQLMPSKEISVPVAVIQAGWFFNPHQANIPFQKEVEAQVIGPEELLRSGSEEKIFHDQYISLKRYEKEVECLCSFIERYDDKKHLLSFFDGSFVVSFAEVLREGYRNKYLEAALHLLKTSEEQVVPVIGYVDTSVARDVLRMLRVFHGDSILFAGSETESSLEGIRDATLFDAYLPNWGDRSIAFELLRPGIMRDYGDVGGGIGIVYLRTALEKPPTRIEFPLWIYKEGLLDWVLDLVRAEVIVGNGYPYCLETADQIAWFSPHDRSRFMHIFRSFLEEHHLPSQISSKLRSKQRRR